MSIDNPALRQFILQSFSDEELETLCFDYFPEVQQNFTDGMTKNRKALLLIAYCETRDRLVDLYGALAREREAAWNRAFGAAPPVETGRRPVSTTSPDRRIHAKTGIELIRIPAGPFLYGASDADTMAYDHEKPQRTVDLPEYWIGRAPVTNDQFARFVQATYHRTRAERQGFGWGWTGSTWDKIQGANWQQPRGPESSIAGKDSHPVVQVSWDDAKAFCDWAGLALPTEEQWEKAARGRDGRIWPWGNEPPTAGHCNFNNTVGDTTPVGEYSPTGDSPYDCVDMAGNVWEWTASWFDQTQSGRVLRGGSWVNSRRYARASIRNYYTPVYALNDIGFRLVAPVVPGS